MVVGHGECWHRTPCAGVSYPFELALAVKWLYRALFSPGQALVPLNPILLQVVVFWLFPTTAMVAQPAERSCAESVQPFLASILEELMGPVSSGFSEVRSLFEKEVDELSQNFQTTKNSAQLKEVGYEAKELSVNALPGAAFSLQLYLHSSILSFPPLSLSPHFLPSIHLHLHPFI